MTPERVGRYLLIREIARGGMGAVYEAEDGALKRRVALKVVRETEADAELVTRLQREATIAAQLQHPNIVAIHEVGTEGPLHFIAMDLVEGRTLDDYVRERHDRAELLRMLEDVARAVHYAHEHGVVHRDLKPANVLVDNARRVLLTDFGLARAEAIHSRLTQSNAAMGTPQYMSPEQVRGDTALADRRADVYALGIMLYEILAGSLPFRGASIAEIFHQILEKDAPRPSQNAPWVGRDFDVVALKAMEKIPSRRYPTALDFADDLGRARRGEHILAKPPGLFASLSKQVARRRAVVSISLAGIVAVLLVAAILLPRIRSERQHALEQLRKRTENALKAALQLRRAGDTAAMEEWARETETACRETIAAFPDLAESRYRLGRMRRAQMRDAEALAEQNGALTIDAAFAPALYERVVLTARLYRQRRDLLILDQWGDEGHLVLRRDGGTSLNPARLLRDDPEAAPLKRRMDDDLRRLDAAKHPLIGAGELACAQGLLAWASGDVVRARDRLKAAVSEVRTLEEGYEALAAIEFDAAAFDASEHWWTAGLEQDRGYRPHREGRALTRLIWGLDRADRTEPSEELFRGALEDYAALITADPAASESRLRRGLTRLSWAASVAKVGGDWFALGDAAREDLSHVIQHAPPAERARVWRGVESVMRAGWQSQFGEDPTEASLQAIADFDVAIRSQPARAASWYYRSLARTALIVHKAVRLQDPRPLCLEAIADLNQAITLQHDRYEFWMWRGIARGMLAIYTPDIPTRDAMTAEALAELDKAIDLAPGRSEPWMYRAQARAFMATLRATQGGDPLPEARDAIADFQKAVSLNRGNIQAWRTLGDAYEGRAVYLSTHGGSPIEDARAALEAWGEATKLNPRLEPLLKQKIANCVRLSKAP